MNQEQMNKLYNEGLDLLREHAEEICYRVMKSRSENRGNFGYLEDKNIKREQKLAQFLQHLLWRMKLTEENKTDLEGYCDQMFIDRRYKRYLFHPQRAPEHWNWQSEEGWRLGVSAVTYVLSCFLMITQLDEVVPYGGIFIVVYVASARAHTHKIWMVNF